MVTAGGDGEDVAGVVEGVADAPAAAARCRGVERAGLDPQRDAGEVGAALAGAESCERRRGGVAALGAQLGFDRCPARLRCRRRRAGPAGRRSCACESCSRSPAPTVGAVMSSVASWRERTSSIAGEGGERVAELGAGDQQLEVGAGVARGAVA